MDRKVALFNILLQGRLVDKMCNAQDSARLVCAFVDMKSIRFRLAFCDDGFELTQASFRFHSNLNIFTPVETERFTVKRKELHSKFEMTHKTPTRKP